MAVTPRHSKSASVWIDSTAGSLVNFSSGLDEASWSQSVDPTDVTNFASGGYREYIAGLRGVEFSMSGQFSSTHAEVLDGVANDATSTTYSLEYSPDGSTAAGRHLLKAELILTSLEYGASVDDKVSLSASFVASGSITSTNH